MLNKEGRRGGGETDKAGERFRNRDPKGRVFELIWN